MIGGVFGIFICRNCWICFLPLYAEYHFLSVQSEIRQRDWIGSNLEFEQENPGEMSPSNGSISANGSNGNRNYIEHPVSKMDTLAGVAIKYGVEVFLL